MQAGIVTVDAEGAITLPAEAVQALGIAEDDVCYFVTDEQGRITLQLLRKTLMSEQDEWLDLVNRHDQVIGQITRENAWAKRQPVRVINAFLTNSRGELWIPRRTASKRMFPNCLDMSVGGHVERGEDYLSAFKRETLEELSLDVDALDWREIAVLSPFETGLSAFMRVYEIRTDSAPDFNPADFSEAWWLTPAELLARIAAGEPAKSDLAELVRRCYP